MEKKMDLAQVLRDGLRGTNFNGKVNGLSVKCENGTVSVEGTVMDYETAPHDGKASTEVIAIMRRARATVRDKAYQAAHRERVKSGAVSVRTRVVKIVINIDDDDEAILRAVHEARAARDAARVEAEAAAKAARKEKLLAELAALEA